MTLKSLFSTVPCPVCGFTVPGENAEPENPEPEKEVYPPYPEFFEGERDGVSPYGYLTALAIFCCVRLHMAKFDGVEIDDGNVIDLIADNSDADTGDIARALAAAGLNKRFPLSSIAATDCEGILLLADLTGPIIRNVARDAFKEWKTGNMAHLSNRGP